MSRKDDCFAILHQSQNEFVSGQKLCTALGISRCAVWKIISQLKKEGHAILSSHHGYCLQNTESPRLNAHAIGARLQGEARACEISVCERTASTNADLKLAGEAGQSAPRVLIARSQDRGRGRMGRSFFSPDKTGLYFSILLRPEWELPESLYLTVCAAVAVSEAIEAVSGRQTGIKWVNDIYMEEKKVCGILTEAAVDMENNRLHYAVVGIGINLLPPADGFPSALADIATSVWQSELDSAPNALCAEILNRFFAYCSDFSSHSILKKYREKSILIGKTVQYVWKGEPMSAKVIGIGDQAELRLQTEDGTIHALQAGEVSVRPTKEDK